MTDAAAVARLLADCGIDQADYPISSGEETGHFLVLVNVLRNSENRQEPSNKKLEDARQHVERIGGVRVEFILRDQANQDIEAGLRATLLYSHIAVIKNVYMSLIGERAHVWLEPKTQIDDPILAEISGRTETYLASLGLELSSIHRTNDLEERLPSNFVILRHLRQIAPALLPELQGRLEMAEFPVPSSDWLRRRLERLRSAQLLIWQHGGYYALTARALHLLGTQKGRDSPDVTRLLAMARGEPYA